MVMHLTKLHSNRSSGVTKGSLAGPRPSQIFAVPYHWYWKDRDTLIEQSNNLIKQSEGQVVLSALILQAITPIAKNTGALILLVHYCWVNIYIRIAYVEDPINLLISNEYIRIKTSARDHYIEAQVVLTWKNWIFVLKMIKSHKKVNIYACNEWIRNVTIVEGSLA